MKRVLLAAVIAALAAAAPATASTLRGVVVARGSGTLAVAAPSGAVTTVRGTARVGSIVRVSRGRVAVIGRAHRARIRGVLVRRVGSTRFIAAGHALFAVHARRGLAAVGDSGPRVGSVVQAEVDIDDQGDLDEESATVVGQATTTQVTATVTSIGVGTITLSVYGQSLTLPLPAGLTLNASLVGSTVTLTLNLGAGAATAQPEQGDDDQGQDDNGGGDDD
jgi:hypothetical protein